MPDEIHILGLEMPSLIGVPDAERSGWQTLSADIVLTLACGFDQMHDELDDTLDYDRAAREATQIAAARPRKLLETLASDLAGHFLGSVKVTAVEVLLRKRILPHTDCVAVRMRREKH